MSVKILVIGDPHFKVNNVKETAAMTEAILSVCQQRKPDLIVVLGDVLDRHETIHVSPLSRATDFLKSLKEQAPLFVLIGNHDLKNNRQFLSTEHPFVSLKEWSDTTIVDTTTVHETGGKKFVFVPYVPPGRFKEALSLVSWEEADCIFAHQEFKGAKMGAVISEEGDDWSKELPLVVSGHIHDFQEVGTNILYTGTPLQHAFGDRHDKTVSWFEFGEKRLHERLDLGLPKKHIVRLTCEEVTNFKPRENCELKIVISGTSAQIRSAMKHPNIEVWKKQGFKIVYKDIPTEPDLIKVAPLKPLKFSTVLYSSVSGNEKLEEAYKKIFGSM